MKKYKLLLTESESKIQISEVEFPIEINGHSNQEMINAALKRCFNELEQKLVIDKEADKYSI